MKGVSGATGAGEIFRKVVYALERSEQTSIPVKKEIKAQPYLIISNPLSGSIYRLEKNNAKTEQVALRFSTNIPHDTASWLLDGKTLDTKFLTPTRGNHTVEVVLIKDGEVVKKEKNVFDVQ